MQNQQSLFDLRVEADITDYLAQSARWAKFLAIVSFIFAGLMVLIGLLAGAMSASMQEMAGMPSDIPLGFVTAVYVISGIISVIPSYLLYKFAVNMQAALRAGDQESFSKSFGSLKACFKFVGVLTIISIVIVVIGFIFAMIGSVMLATAG